MFVRRSQMGLGLVSFTNSDGDIFPHRQPHNNVLTVVSRRLEYSPHVRANFLNKKGECTREIIFQSELVCSLTVSEWCWLRSWQFCFMYWVCVAQLYAHHLHMKHPFAKLKHIIMTCKMFFCLQIDFKHISLSGIKCEIYIYSVIYHFRIGLPDTSLRMVSMQCESMQ